MSEQRDEEEHVGDLAPNVPDCGARGEFMPNCGQMEGTDSCWACGRTRAEHDTAEVRS